MRIDWPVCRVHRRRIEHYPHVEVGSHWKCPECLGAENTSIEEEQE